MEITNLQNIASIILAAGEGTRIRSTLSADQNKVTIKVGDKPLVYHTVQKIAGLNLGQIIVVVGYNKESVVKAIGSGFDVLYANQPERLGTGHAVECALASLSPVMEYVLVLNGDDSALLPEKILIDLVRVTQQADCVFSILTTLKEDPTGLGRIVRDNGTIKAIVEEKNANQEQKLIKEINTGVFCFRSDWLKANIGKVQPNPVNHERYLTDLVSIACENQECINSVTIEEKFVKGVNTPEDLQRLQAIFA